VALPAEPWNGQTWPAWLAALGSGEDDAAKLRLILTGEEHGPELAEILPLIGRSRVLERLRGA
jgi:glutamyl-tRNA synthetase